VNGTDLAAIQRLQQAGLLVRPFGPIGPFANGFKVGKPAGTLGNSRPGPNSFWGADKIPVNAPIAQIYPWEGQWIFQVSEYIPGPGPGDFVRFFDTLDEAVTAVLDYYFGDPTVMNPPELNDEQ
jgi:hypothetical protein